MSPGWLKGLAALTLTSGLFAPFFRPLPAFAVSCSSQAQMTDAERNGLVSAARQLAAQVQAGNVAAVRAATIPSVAAQFGGISSEILTAAPLTAGATITVVNVYALDAGDLAAGEEQAQFFCGGSDSPDVVFSIPQIPPGKYGMVMIHATGVPQPQQFSFLLSQGVEQGAGMPAGNSNPATKAGVGTGPGNGPSTGSSASPISGQSVSSTGTGASNANMTQAASPALWKLAGLFVRPLTSAGHDGLWYWTKARSFAKSRQNWNAYFYYQTAESLLAPVDFVSTPNLEKLIKEQGSVAPDTLPGKKPLTLSFNGHSYSLTGLHTEGLLGGLDLVISYDASDNSDPVATRTRNVEVMQAMLRQHPELREGFHGLWVYSNVSNQRAFANELPMSQIP